MPRQLREFRTLYRFGLNLSLTSLRSAAGLIHVMRTPFQHIVMEELSGFAGGSAIGTVTRCSFNNCTVFGSTSSSTSPTTGGGLCRADLTLVECSFVDCTRTTTYQGSSAYAKSSVFARTNSNSFICTLCTVGESEFYLCDHTGTCPEAIPPVMYFSPVRSVRRAISSQKMGLALSAERHIGIASHVTRRLANALHVMMDTHSMARLAF